MSTKRAPIKCAEPGCDVEFYPGDPRARFCNKHHFAMLSRVLARAEQGQPLPDAVGAELDRVTSQETTDD